MKQKVWLQAVTNLLLIAILSIPAWTCLTDGGEGQEASKPFYGGNSSANRVGIMINVYEGREYVEQILTILDKCDAVCTFFVGGVWVEKNMDLLPEMCLHAEIGNHGYLHRDHALLSEKENRDEILLCHRLVRTITTTEMNLFAPPSGSYSENTLKVCEENGYKVIMWSKDTIDWRDKDENLIYKRATASVKGGDLILMHPTQQTVNALPKVLRYYRENGLLPSVVSDVINA